MGLKRKCATIVIALILCLQLINAQKEDKVKTGYMYIPLPVFQYDSDKGTIMGLAFMLYDFDEGQYYPNTKKDITLNAMYSTKGATDLGLNIDLKKLKGDYRLKSEIGFKNDICNQFYGFNGYQAPFIDTIPLSFYYYNLKTLRFKSILLKDIGSNFKFKGGINFQYFDIQNANLNKINKGQKESDKYFDETLYEKYLNWGIIKGNEAHGDFLNSYSVGLSYDSRDQEAAPRKGIFADLDFEVTPKFLGNPSNFCKYEFNWRQYITFLFDKVTLAYRVDYQGTIGNNVPFYAMPVSSTVRGMMSNRIQALDIASTNIELRWLSKNMVFLNQNLAFGLNTFFDSSIGTRFYNTDFNGTSEYKISYDEYIKNGSDEKIHHAIGFGTQFLINRNFICRIEFGHAMNSQDNFGNSTYFTFGYLF